MGRSNSKDAHANESTGRIWTFVMLGIGGVGKSALTIQFVQDKFIRDYDPTIEDSYRKQVVVDGKVAMLMLWDTAGQEEYEALQDGYIRESDGFAIIYSITDRRSFEQITKYYRKILRVKDSPSEPIILMGTKSDLEDQREVTTVEGQKLANELGCIFMETSAKTRANVNEGFFALLRSCRQKPSR